MIRKMRLVVMGHGGHGKGSVCALLEEMYGLRSISSSMALLPVCVYPAMQDRYDTQAACHADRGNNRTEWGDRIAEYNTPDKTRTARLIFDELKCDVYDGLRRSDEFYPVQHAGMFDFALWVDASERLALESSESITVNRSMADAVINNNGPAHDLLGKVVDVYEWCYRQHQKGAA